MLYQSSAIYEIKYFSLVVVELHNQSTLKSELNLISVNAFYGKSLGANKRPNIMSKILLKPTHSFSQPQTFDCPKQKK